VLFHSLELSVLFVQLLPNVGLGGEAILPGDDGGDAGDVAAAQREREPNRPGARNVTLLRLPLREGALAPSGTPNSGASFRARFQEIVGSSPRAYRHSFMAKA
jgi:hypothetical protein